MPTIKEIAKACNVSVATVSNIINHKGSVGDATRERVEKVIREMNYTQRITTWQTPVTVQKGRGNLPRL